MRIFQYIFQLRSRVLPILMGPPILAFLPAITLGAFWIGGEAALMFASLALPLMFAFAGALGKWPADATHRRDHLTGLVLRDEFLRTVEDTFAETQSSGLKSANFLIELDEFKELSDKFGQATYDLVMQRSGERILSAVRDQDTIARLDNGTFAVCLSPVPQLDLELCIQLAGRIQSAVEDPISVDGASVYVSCSIGFC